MNHISLKLVIIYCVSLFLLWQCTTFFTATNTPSFARPVALQPVTRNSRLDSIGAGGAYVNVQTYPANCKGITTTAIGSLKYFSGLLQSDINKKYLNNNKILCYDLWKSTWTVANSESYLSTVFLKDVGWPSDFLATQKDVTLIIYPIEGPKQPVTPPKTTTSSNTTTTQEDDQPKNSCDWVPDLVVAHPHIDICAFFVQILNSNIAQPLEKSFNQVSNQANGFLWSTPAQDTYQNTDFKYFWDLSLWLVNAYLVVVIAWVALRGSIIKTFSWLSYADVLEYLPRIGFGLLLAYSSKHLIQLVIDGSNALCNVFSHALFDSFAIQSNATDMVTITLHIVYLIMGLLLILEEGARYTILFVIIAFFPVLVFTASTKETQFIARRTVRGFVFMTILQPVQMAVMAVGVTVLKTLLHSGDTVSILNYLVSIGLMVFVLSLFFSFFHMAFGSISTPFVATASGLAAASAGKTVRGGHALMAGRAAIQRATKNMIQAMPPVAHNAPAAAVGAYNAVRSVPSGISAQYIRTSNAYKTFDQDFEHAYDRMVGRPSHNTAATNTQITSKTSTDTTSRRVPPPQKKIERK